VTSPDPAGAAEGHLDALTGFVRRKGMGWWLCVLLLFKFGDHFSSGMLRPFLVDAGLSLGDIGWLVGLVGFAAGLVGALAGGWGTQRLGHRRALVVFGIMQTMSLLIYVVPALGYHQRELLWCACALEHFTSGLATVALFTMMMDMCRPDHAASDYTLQASVVVIENLIAAGMSGYSAVAFGYAGHFAISALLSLMGVYAINLYLVHFLPVEPART